MPEGQSLTTLAFLDGLLEKLEPDGRYQEPREERYHPAKADGLYETGIASAVA